MNRANSREKTARVAFLGMIFALAMTLSFIEHSLPTTALLPPGVKLGLSNIVTMYCLFTMGFGSAFTVAVLKSAFVFFVRGPVAFFLSLCGGMASIVVMHLLLKLRRSTPSYMIISVAGAIFHNLGQLLGTTVVLRTHFSLYYIPVMIVSGVGMGILTGILVRTVMPALEKIRQKAEG
jgi:heptaprenyl diphosphate synthase